MSLLKLFDRFVALLAAVVRVVCIVLTIALFVIVIAAIVARYGFGQAVSWTEEVPRYLLIWISFLGAAVVRAAGAIMSASTCCSTRCPKPVRRVLGVLLSLLIFGFGWIVFRYGIVFVQDFGGDLMETIPYKNYWYYPAMPISGFLMMVFALKLMIDEIVRPDGRRHHRPDGGLSHDPPHPRPRLHPADRRRPADLVRGRRRLGDRRPSCCRASTTPRSCSAC